MTSTETVPTDQIRSAAVAFVYRYPLVYYLREIAKFPAGPNLAQAEPLPYDTFGYARKLQAIQRLD